jgi:hypothetical protein
MYVNGSTLKEVSVLDKWRVAFLVALGGKCVRCGCTDLRELEVHDTTGEHKGYGNKQRLEDIRQFKLTGRVPPGRFLLCWKCHHLGEHGSARSKVKLQIEEKLGEIEQRAVEERTSRTLERTGKPNAHAKVHAKVNHALKTRRETDASRTVEQTWEKHGKASTRQRTHVLR